MVDFQSRDTTYGATDDEKEEADETDEDATSRNGNDGEEPDDHDEHGHDQQAPDDHDHHDSDEHSHDEHDHHVHDEHGHDHHDHDKSELGIGVVTVTSTRTLDADPSGDAIESTVEAGGHNVVTRELVGDTRDSIQSIVDTLVDRSDVDLVVTTGGTGVSPDDVTIEALRPLFEKDLPGFGEVFRSLSYEDIGTKVVGTRTTAGIVNGVPVFALPGSENAVTLATEEIILPEGGHLAGLATRGLEAEGEDEEDAEEDTDEE